MRRFEAPKMLSRLGWSGLAALALAPSCTARPDDPAASSRDPASPSPEVLRAAAPDVVSVTISPPSAGVTLGQEQQFTATVTGTTKTGVTWSVDGVHLGDATVGTISASGLYTPPATAGAHTIRAKSLADKTASGTARVGVTDLAGVLTWHNDVARTGQNLQEYALSHDNVTSSTFGKLFSCPVDGYVYAQPLWVPGVVIGGAAHNVVYVATENDSVYAYDADSSQPVLWQVSLGKPVPCADTGDTEDLLPTLGVTGTPVIDPSSSTLYVVAETKVTKPTTSYHHKLHALDLATGAEKFGGPVEINPTVPGTGGNSVGGMIQYAPLDHFQRPALLLQGGVVYVAIGSSADTTPSVSHGWIVGFDAATLALTLQMCTTPNGTMGSIWESGGGIAVDTGGSLYVETGNGTFDANVSGGDYGDSALRLDTSGNVLDYFTPFNQALLNTNDIDLGTAGPVVLPDQPGAVPHELIVTGKPGLIYVLNRDAMGGFNPKNNDQIVQTVDIGRNTSSVTGGNYATVAYFDENLYLADVGSPGDGKLKAFRMKSGLLPAKPTSESSVSYGYPGATPVVSANGASDGIVWALQGQGYTPSTAPILHAYDASNLATELYNSTLAGSRDTPGPAVKFVVPTLANGKVYVPTQTEVTVFGLLP